MQNELPQDVPLWYEESFELKATLAGGSGETSTPSLNYQEGYELGALSTIKEIIRDNFFDLYI